MNEIIKSRRYQAGKIILHAIKKGHPWIYSKSFSSAIDAVPSGSLLRIVDGSNNFVSHAIYEPTGMVGARILTTKEPFKVHQLNQRIKLLLEKKSALNLNGYRLINGEGDRFPALVCDIYNDLAVWQPYLSFWDNFLPKFADTLEEFGGIKHQIVKEPASKENFKQPYLLKGELPNEPFHFDENGTTLSAFPLTGQKTGFFLDLREVRERLATMLKGKSLLNTFSNSGAFTVIAKLNSASSILSIDSDVKIEGQLKKSLEVNGFRIKKGEFIKGDVWEELVALRLSDKKFDLIILDPPNICKSKKALKPAFKGWQKLFESALPLLNDDGEILAINCSPFMDKDDCQKVLKSLPVKLKITAQGGLPPDHTIKKSFPEGNYLNWFLTKQTDN